MALRGGARPGAGRKQGQVSAATRSLSDMAKKHAQAALKTLIDIAKNTEANDAARVSAANAILDRGYGKPKQSVEVDGAGLAGLSVTYVAPPPSSSLPRSPEDYETD